jgi:hypothetical protein
VTWATDHAKDQADWYKEVALKIALDPDKEKRAEKAECLTCFYANTMRAGGAALTTQPCGLCGKSISSGNTCIDVICRDCAIEHELCKHCGADIKLRVRRVFRAKQ